MIMTLVCYNNSVGYFLLAVVVDTTTIHVTTINIVTTNCYYIAIATITADTTLTTHISHHSSSYHYHLHNIKPYHQHLITHPKSHTYTSTLLHLHNIYTTQIIIYLY